MAEKRRRLREKAKSAAKSVAGTVSEAAKTTARGAKEFTRDMRERATPEDTPTGQEAARLERAKASARQEALRDAQQEFRKEYKEDLKDELQEQEIERLRREYGTAGSDDEPQRKNPFLLPEPPADQEAEPRRLLGPPPRDSGGDGGRDMDGPFPAGPMLGPPRDEGKRDRETRGFQFDPWP